MATTSPTGYGPAQFHGAYNLPNTAPSAQTIAIVDAYDSPTIESDLGVFSSQYGLPACTTANGCFKKVNQNGVQGSYPSVNAGWALEIALDVETAHAICQNCKILLVEADSNSFANLSTAENTAASLGATEISNSYGGGEYSGETSDTSFNHPGIAITASAGDNGYGAEYPAASPYVVAVGGTTLNLGAGDAYGSETVWNGTGSGCSAYTSAQPWQTSDANWSQTGCGTKRGIADVAADADPNTGASVYDTTKYQGQSGWFQVGGTSLSAPLIASVYALAGGTSANYPAAVPYGHQSDSPASLHDVTSGSNGNCATIMCSAAVGYDGPTGVGTPRGLAAFGGGPITSYPPVVNTGSATSIAQTSATLNGTVNPNGQSTTYHFDWGTTASYGSSTSNQSAGSGTSNVSVSADLTGLSAGTTYHYRLVASNNSGTTNGSDATFTTPAAPTVTTDPATSITQSGATLNGSANPKLASTTGWFRYATTSPGTCNDSFGTRAPASGGSALGSGSSGVAYSQALSGLSPGTTYYFCALASNSVGTSFGAVLSFTTSASPPPPTVTTDPATSVAQSSATVNGTVNPNDQSTSYHFDWGTTASYGSSTSTQSAVSGTSDVAVSADLTGLSPGTTYHYRLVATNNSGTTNGSDATFTTSSAFPPPSSPPATLGAISPTVLISSVPVTLTKGGVAKLRLTCSATESGDPCVASLQLRTKGKVRFGGQRRKVTLGSATASIALGETAIVAVKLSRARRTLVHRLGSVMATATAKVHDSLGNFAVVTQAFKLKAH